MNDDLTDDGGEEFTELFDASIPRVDLVGKGANGLPFLIAKSDAGGLLDADTVRDLISKSGVSYHGESGRRVEGGPVMDKVTLSGTAAAITEMIHRAAMRQSIAKKDFDTAERDHDAATGAAMPDGSYPIENTSQLEDAIHAVGRAQGSHDDVRRHIMQRAKSLGAESKIPDNWNADGSLKEGNVTKQDVAKAGSTDNDAANSDAASAVLGDNEPLPDADELMGSAQESADGSGVPANADGDPDDPDSPAWEAVDAARARQAVQLAIALKRMVELAQTREQQEASVGSDSDDVENVFCLDDVLCAIDCIVSVLAPFAVTEQAEADERQADLDALTKGQVRKAGRVLSAANEAAIRSASELLEKVLATLPAPVESDQEVAKSKEEPTMTEQVEKAAEDTAAEQDVAKAKGDPQVAVYTADGKLVGVVDQADISPIAAPAAPEGGDEQGGDDSTGDSSGDAPAEAPAAPAPDADDAATIPGTDTVQAPPAAPDDDDTVQKATEPLTKAHLEEVLTSLISKVGEKADASIVKALQEELAEVKKMPDDRKSPRLNGATGAAGIADRDGTTTDPHTELRKAVDDATDPVAKAAAAKALSFALIKDRFTSN